MPVPGGGQEWGTRRGKGAPSGAAPRPIATGRAYGLGQGCPASVPVLGGLIPRVEPPRPPPGGVSCMPLRGVAEEDGPGLLYVPAPLPSPPTVLLALLRESRGDPPSLAPSSTSPAKDLLLCGVPLLPLCCVCAE